MQQQQVIYPFPPEILVQPELRAGDNDEYPVYAESCKWIAKFEDNTKYNVNERMQFYFSFVENLLAYMKTQSILELPLDSITTHYTGNDGWPMEKEHYIPFPNRSNLKHPKIGLDGMLVYQEQSEQKTWFGLKKVKVSTKKVDLRDLAGMCDLFFGQKVQSATKLGRLTIDSLVHSIMSEAHITN
ncbi:MAG: hypothetical protein HY438_02890 [DPANN group archaeon]|nr:hypothetical protein [DPANN group archaeon]